MSCAQPCDGPTAIGSEMMRNRPAELAGRRLAEATHTVRMDKFGDAPAGASLARAMLARISQTMQGTAAANTANRKRMVLNNAMGYACEIGLLTDNPLHYVKWTRPRTKTAVDPRVVINTDQAHRFLAAVESHSPRGRRLKAFFGCMYYAGLRPEEATELRRSNLTCPTSQASGGRCAFPKLVPDREAAGPTPVQVRERYRSSTVPEGDTRRVPVHPELVDVAARPLARTSDRSRTPACSWAYTAGRSATGPT